MTAKIYPPRKVKIQKDGGPVSLHALLIDKTEGDPVMSFTSNCQWIYFPSGQDPDPSKPKDSDSLDDLEALIKLGERPSKYNISRVDVAVTCGELADKKHKYSVKMFIRQNGAEADEFETGDREFEDVDVFTASFVFVH